MFHVTELGTFSIGVGDRFAHQARPQLRACMLAASNGAAVTPVWNKSFREHSIVGSEPMQTREAADAAVGELGWKSAYFLDADHINFSNVNGFLPTCDFYTLDVAYAIGTPAPEAAVDNFISLHPELAEPVAIDGLDEPVVLGAAQVRCAAGKYLFACQEAGRIYRAIENAKGRGNFVTEVSMDETDEPQSPADLLLILAALADEGIPVQTIAPRFSGRFNKGVDYVGDVARFAREFLGDVAVVRYAAASYGLPANLKLSVHSGSDKFSIYGPIRAVLQLFGAGVHLKTAGTTWLEELIGLAEAGGEGLAIAKEIYAGAYDHREEMCAPYASVIDIDPARLPAPAVVSAWTPEEYTAALRHDQSNPAFNPDLRQLLHVGYKVAARMGERYLRLLDECERSISWNVTENLYQRHIRPLFV